MPPSLGAFFYFGFVMNRFHSYLLLLPFFAVFDSHALQCSPGSVDVEGVCVSSCKILQGTGKNLTWDAYIWGANPRFYCIGNSSTGAACSMTAGPVSISVEGNKWTNKFTYTGSTCAFDEINRFFGDTPEPFPWENDVNQNGVDDALEDWDGDGIPNGEDPNPYKNDNVVVDSNGNGIPDSVENVYESLLHVAGAEPVNCYYDDPNCDSYRGVMNSLVSNNRTFAYALSEFSKNSVTRGGFNESIGGLVSTINTNDNYFKSKLDSLSSASGDTLSALINAMSNTEQSLSNLINHKLDGIGNLGGGLTDSQHSMLAEARTSSVSNLAVTKEIFDMQAATMSQAGAIAIYTEGLIEDGVKTLSDKIDAIEGADMTGVEGQLDDLIDGVTNNDSFVVSDSGFDGKDFIISESQLSQTENEILDIKEQLTTETDKFKSLFSIDTSSFNNGTFKEHTLNLNVNGSERSFKSGVLSALLDNAAIISAVIMFLFVLSGIRMLGKD